MSYSVRHLLLFALVEDFFVLVLKILIPVILLLCIILIFFFSLLSNCTVQFYLLNQCIYNYFYTTFSFVLSFSFCWCLFLSPISLLKLRRVACTSWWPSRLGVSVCFCYHALYQSPNEICFLVTMMPYDKDLFASIFPHDTKYQN